MAHEHDEHDELDLEENVNVAVSVSNSLSFPREWIRKTKFLHANHIHDLQVGVAIRTNQAGDDVFLALCVGNRCLVIRLPDMIEGCLADFLTADTNRFVGLHQEPPIELANYKTAAQLGDNHQLNPVVAWNNWPLNDDQVNEAAIESVLVSSSLSVTTVSDHDHVWFSILNYAIPV
ncbi:unnamed protein product [Arabidopsis lyrata]|uniref:Predicted protein n=1 Tax=Arabidopsis lyrata subsp. lyrata TaxID=81972 RepID=D7LJK7_ARALL|nr:uncharacterized protein LOC9317062 [Arabidopsis lyrata subsp. lyrata]EFH57254.1 predicted protein [Arabidopsis lyrata subsp. lyrata]CAH8264026.1 unnamed protein product [Arabidopsis lyrata]|eukprot:XP_002880995.1 uncharacterized protein LOC9317062 [Arabidopsis lyrata subsp. lyrata]